MAGRLRWMRTLASRYTFRLLCFGTRGARGGEGALAPSCRAPQGHDQTSGDFFPFFRLAEGASRAKLHLRRNVASLHLRRSLQNSTCDATLRRNPPSFHRYLSLSTFLALSLSLSPSLMPALSPPLYPPRSRSLSLSLLSESLTRSRELSNV